MWTDNSVKKGFCLSCLLNYCSNFICRGTNQLSFHDIGDIENNWYNIYRMYKIRVAQVSSLDHSMSLMIAVSDSSKAPLHFVREDHN